MITRKILGKKVIDSIICKHGGLDLSRRGLDRESRFVSTWSRSRVSICLDVVSIESLDLDVVKEWVSTVEKISTASKSASRQSRNLDLNRDFSILSRHQCPDQKVSIEIKKFVKIWKFQGFSTVCLNLNLEVRGFLHFLVKISQSVKTFHHFQTQKALTMLRFLDKSWQSWHVLTNLDNLDVSRQSRQKSQRVKVSTEKSQF